MNETTGSIEPLRSAVEVIWTSLGMSTWSNAGRVVPVDPEAAVIVALQLFGVRSRFGFEVMDWAVDNGQWLLINRMRRLAQSAPTAVRDDVETFVATVARDTSELRWRTEADTIADFQPSRKSAQLPTDAAASRLRARAALGASARTDVLYLLAAGGERVPWTAARLVAASGMARTRIYDVLVELERAGVVESDGSKRGATVRLRTDNELARSIAGIAPRAAVAPWDVAVSVVNGLDLAAAALAQGTIATLATAKRHVAEIQSVWSPAAFADDLGEAPDQLRVDLADRIARTAREFAFALVNGPALGAFRVSADAERARLEFFADRSVAIGTPDAWMELERRPSGATMSQRAAPPHMSDRVLDQLYRIADDAITDAHRSGVSVERSGVVS